MSQIKTTYLCHTVQYHFRTPNVCSISSKQHAKVANQLQARPRKSVIKTGDMGIVKRFASVTWDRSGVTSIIWDELVASVLRKETRLQLIAMLHQTHAILGLWIMQLSSAAWFWKRHNRVLETGRKKFKRRRAVNFPRSVPTTTITIARGNSDWYVDTFHRHVTTKRNLLFEHLSGKRLVWRKKTMPVPPTRRIDQLPCCASLCNANWGYKKWNTGCDESTVHECVIDVDDCGCECESETRQEIGCAHYVSVFFYCVRPSSSFASPSSIRRLGLGPHGQITYCMPGDEQNEYTLK